MQQVIDHFGVAIAAVTGVLAARGKQVDLFGVIVLALVTALTPVVPDPHVIF